MSRFYVLLFNRFGVCQPIKYMYGLKNKNSKIIKIYKIIIIIILIHKVMTKRKNRENNYGLLLYKVFVQ